MKKIFFHKVLFEKINQMTEILHVGYVILKKTCETSRAEYFAAWSSTYGGYLPWASSISSWW
jgi:hypothetical protein